MHGKKRTRLEVVVGGLGTDGKREKEGKDLEE